ncbi:MAG: S1 RNA-binding domain-containing protein [Candidatus Lokiarchaeota archaeon]|jgi:translation initiation factor 2 subunit 1
MVKSRTPFPKEGEFVIGRVVDIQQQYIYVDLLDYDGLSSEEYARGMIHISEISSRWIKNIRNFARVGQRIVVRVLRVDQSKGHVDLSLRRVNSAQKDNRMKEWKYAVKYENLLQFFTEEEGINLSLDQAYELIGWPALDKFDSYQETIESLKEYGDEILQSLGTLDEGQAKAFMKIVDENVEISTVSIVGKLKLMNTDGDGIEKIKNSLIEATKVVEKPKETRNIKISYIGAPFYRVEIISKDYLDAENILSDSLEIIESMSKEYNSTFEFIRD